MQSRKYFRKIAAISRQIEMTEWENFYRAEREKDQRKREGK